MEDASRFFKIRMFHDHFNLIQNIIVSCENPARTQALFTALIRSVKELLLYKSEKLDWPSRRFPQGPDLAPCILSSASFVPVTDMGRAFQIYWEILFQYKRADMIQNNFNPV